MLILNVPWDNVANNQKDSTEVKPETSRDFEVCSARREELMREEAQMTSGLQVGIHYVHEEVGYRNKRKLTELFWYSSLWGRKKCFKTKTPVALNQTTYHGSQ